VTTIVYEVTAQDRADALTWALRTTAPRIRFTRGMALAARRLEHAADRRAALEAKP
jgi:hypothetical protein